MNRKSILGLISVAPLLATANSYAKIDDSQNNGPNFRIADLAIKVEKSSDGNDPGAPALACGDSTTWVQIFACAGSETKINQNALEHSPFEELAILKKQLLEKTEVRG